MTTYGIKVQCEIEFHDPKWPEDKTETRYIPIPNAIVHHDPNICNTDPDLAKRLNLDLRHECTCQEDRTARTSALSGLELGVAHITLEKDTGTHSHIFVVTNVHLPNSDPIIAADFGFPGGSAVNQEGQDTVELTFAHDPERKRWFFY